MQITRNDETISSVTSQQHDHYYITIEPTVFFFLLATSMEDTGDDVEDADDDVAPGASIRPPGDNPGNHGKELPAHDEASWDEILKGYVVPEIEANMGALQMYVESQVLCPPEKKQPLLLDVVVVGCDDFDPRLQR